MTNDKQYGRPSAAIKKGNDKQYGHVETETHYIDTEPRGKYRGVPQAVIVEVKEFDINGELINTRWEAPKD